MPEKKIHVAMIIQAYYPIVGGAERQLGTLAPLLAQKGLQVSILTRKRLPDSPLYELVDGIPVYRIPAQGPRVAASLLFTARSLRVLAQLKPDIVHAHELLSPTTTAVAYKAVTGTPVVAKVLSSGVGDVFILNQRGLKSIRSRLILRRVDRYITISRAIGDELARAGIPASRQAWIPNGVDTVRFSPVDTLQKEKLRGELGLPSGPLAVYTGRLGPEKNALGLVSAWSVVREQIPDAALLVIGIGEQEEEIRKIAGGGVVLLGKKNDVAPYLQASDLFILPSLAEGLSNALLEAMACGLPAVATAVGGNPELITAGQTGLLVPPGDIPALSRAVIEILKDEPLRCSMGLRCREQISAAYPIDKTVDRLIQLYGELLS